MDKIYDNLNVDNLMNSEKYELFTKKQREEIKVGLEKSLNVSLYAKKYFSFNQMKEIRLGLEKNLDVSMYTIPEYNSEQMKEKRLELESNRGL